MRSRRLMLAATALLAVAGLTACGGSDSDGGEQSAADAASASARESASQLAARAFDRKCTVHVEATGAAEAAWDGKGTVSNASDVTTYHAADGSTQVYAYAGKGDIPTNANITIDGSTYTTTDPDNGLEIAGNGTSAKIDADTTGIEGPGPHLTATFTCGKGAKGKGKG